jgi:purine-binding chemotaxis protein CheW
LIFSCRRSIADINQRDTRKQLMAVHDLEILVFDIGGQRYGLPAKDVLELLRAVAIVPLPQAPAIVEGIINLRGSLVPVLDIRSRFRLPAKPLEPSDHLVVALAGDRRVALRVDRALDLVRVHGDDIEDARGVVPGVEYVSWVAKQPNELVLIHDLRTFLSRAEGAALERSLLASPGESP